jgi:hypothetical protein
MRVNRRQAARSGVCQSAATAPSVQKSISDETIFLPNAPEFYLFSKREIEDFSFKQAVF